jgi:proteasome lid subunit RPN8/RPN11
MMEKPKELENLTDEELIEEFNEVHHKKKYKKHISFFMLGLSLILILSYIYLSYPVYDVLAGKIESQKINDNTIISRNINIIFQNQTEKIVFEAYKNNPDVETTLCMKGNVQDNNYYITEIYKPVIYSQSFRHVTHQACSQDTIAMFHTHPYKRCVGSSQDIRTLRNAQETNSDTIMIIMCEPDRFSIYR